MGIISEIDGTYIECPICKDRRRMEVGVSYTFYPVYGYRSIEDWIPEDHKWCVLLNSPRNAFFLIISVIGYCISRLFGGE